MSSLIRTALLIATCVVPHSVRAQSGKPPISPAPLTVRGCEMVLHARNEGSNDLTIDVAASTAQPGAGAWTSILGGSPVNMASALTSWCRRTPPASVTGSTRGSNAALNIGTNSPSVAARSPTSCSSFLPAARIRPTSRFASEISRSSSDRGRAISVHTRPRHCAKAALSGAGSLACVRSVRPGLVREGGVRHPSLAHPAACLGFGWRIGHFLSDSTSP